MCTVQRSQIVKSVMLRTPGLVRRLTQMSADSGQVATALKSVLDKASAAAQRSGKNTKVKTILQSTGLLVQSRHRKHQIPHCILMACRVMCIAFCLSTSSVSNNLWLKYNPILSLCSHAWLQSARQSLSKLSEKPTKQGKDILVRITSR